MTKPGLLCRAATTFTASGALDEQALREFLQRFVDTNIGVYLASGGSGEGHALTFDEIRRVYAELKRFRRYVSQWNPSNPRWIKMAMRVLKLPGGAGGVREPYCMPEPAAQARPGQLNYASGAAGSPNHIAAELFKALARINIVRIPYKGSGPALNALIGGQVELAFAPAASAMLHVRNGRLRALGVTSAEPSALAPGVPTVAAGGLPGYESVANYGVFAPTGTSAALVSRLNKEIVLVVKRPDIAPPCRSGGLTRVDRPGSPFEVILDRVTQSLGIREMQHCGANAFHNAAVAYHGVNKLSALDPLLGMSFHALASKGLHGLSPPDSNQSHGLRHGEKLYRSHRFSQEIGILRISQSWWAHFQDGVAHIGHSRRFGLSWGVHEPAVQSAVQK